METKRWLKDFWLLVYVTRDKFRIGRDVPNIKLSFLFIDQNSHLNGIMDTSIT